MIEENMLIIQPATNKHAEKVKNWKEIKQEAGELCLFLENKEFKGYWQEAYALQHTQVSRDPKNFFVVGEKMKKTFGSWCIINLEILKRENPIAFHEACMSFPFRKPKWTERSSKIKVKYYIPVFNLFLFPKWKTFEQLPAFICQHEEQHSRGESIYFSS